MTAVNANQQIRFNLEPVGSLDALQAEWNRFDLVADHSFFSTWTWIGTWLRMLPWDFTPQLLTARRDHETIAAAILVPRREKFGISVVHQFYFNSTGEPEYDCLTTEHNDFAGTREGQVELWQAFLAWFAARSRVDELIIPGVEQQNVLVALPAYKLLKTIRNVPAFRVANLASIAEAGIDPLLSRNSRQRLRRSLRDYAQQGPLHIDEASNVETALSYFDELKVFHINSWERRGKPHAFRYPFFERFHRELIKVGVPKGEIQLLKISAGTRAIGYLYNFRRCKKIYAYQSGFEFSTPHLRPGYVSHALAMRSNAERGERIYDFLGGDNPLKRSFADDHYFISWSAFRQRRLSSELLTWPIASRIKARRAGAMG
jgi:CelD/BcsL family acetyltransferase involved in cellulose biosynthesis